MEMQRAEDGHCNKTCKKHHTLNWQTGGWGNFVLKHIHETPVHMRPPVQRTGRSPSLTAAFRSSESDVRTDKQTKNRREPSPPRPCFQIFMSAGGTLSEIFTHNPSLSASVTQVFCSNQLEVPVTKLTLSRLTDPQTMRHRPCFALLVPLSQPHDCTVHRPQGLFRGNVGVQLP
jgi:hypothetical protein